LPTVLPFFGRDSKIVGRKKQGNHLFFFFSFVSFSFRHTPYDPFLFFFFAPHGNNKGGWGQPVVMDPRFFFPFSFYSLSRTAHAVMCGIFFSFSPTCSGQLSQPIECTGGTSRSSSFSLLFLPPFCRNLQSQHLPASPLPPKRHRGRP